MMTYEETAKYLLAEANLTRCWDIYEDPTSPKRLEEDGIREIVGKTVHFGSIFERQIAVLRTLLEQIDRRVAFEAQHGEPPDCPKGKLQITGEIIKLDEAASNWGSRNVMIVRDNRGFEVYGTVPKSLGKVECGDQVTFYAMLTQSRRSVKFGFFSKPTKAEVLVKVET